MSTESFGRRRAAPAEELDQLQPLAGIPVALIPVWDPETAGEALDAWREMVAQAVRDGFVKGLDQLTATIADAARSGFEAALMAPIPDLVNPGPLPDLPHDLMADPTDGQPAEQPDEPLPAEATKA